MHGESEFTAMSENPADEPITVANLLRHIDQEWADLMAYVMTLSPVQLAELHDAAGWAVKDHLIHLAVWERGITALLAKAPRLAAMGIDAATWDADLESGADQVNTAIYVHYGNLTIAEVQATMQRDHTQLVATLTALTDADIQQPYRAFQSDTEVEEPVWGWIVGNTYMHYREHRPWIEAIAAQQS